VVTFNQQQRAYVEGLLRDAGDQRLVDALDAPDGLFVKNLENVQGDERDVILFSTAFSVNDRGVLPLNFGPLNRAGGERRLNVAVTRARRRVAVYSSCDPAQLRTEETSSVGLRHLRSYLEMAAAGPDALPHDTQRRRLPDRHREEIAEALRAKSIDVRTDVGLSEFAIDLVLGTDNGPGVAVLLDGPGWASRRTARDRDALPREVLAGVLGWPVVERVWLPDWLKDPEAVVARLVAATARPETPAVVPPSAPPVVVPAAASAAPDDEGARPEAPRPEPLARIASVATAVRGMPEAPVVASAGPSTSGSSSGGVAFVPWTVHHLGTRDVLDRLPDYHAASLVASAITEVVTAEGPIHVDRLATLVARGFGLDRVRESRKDAILRHLPRRLRKDRAEPVVWPLERDPDEWTGFRRTPDGVDRPFDHVPRREIANAMVTVARASAGISVEELHREALSVFGGRRRTSGIAGRLDAALALGVRLGRLVERDGVVRAV
jgi:hypothetical protein